MGHYKQSHIHYHGQRKERHKSIKFFYVAPTDPRAYGCSRTEEVTIKLSESHLLASDYKSLYNASLAS